MSPLGLIKETLKITKTGFFLKNKFYSCFRQTVSYYKLLIVRIVMR